MPSKRVSILILLPEIYIIAGMKAAAPILNPLFLSIFSAVICLPPLAWLNNKGISSSLAVFLVVGVFRVFMLSVLSMLLPSNFLFIRKILINNPQF
ncbi:MAG: hypothetical protein RQ733_08905 [Methyloprofundus sp.]|nr:hypothetical protein [Methyloprofundus sp.]MDT8426078.1 hypothetical protein [Methyloprofundus sp.]